MSVPPIALGQGPFAGVMLRLDLATGGPPWPLLLWNHQSQAWESVAQRAVSSSLLVCTPSKNAVSGDYLATAGGEAVLTASGSPITLGPLRVIKVPDFVLTASGDVIGVPGR